jgi:DnaJ-class molecular chaperone
MSADDSEPVPCPVCGGAGCRDDDPEVSGAVVPCDECGGSGEVPPEYADKLARERASCVSISSYLDDR